MIKSRKLRYLLYAIVTTFVLLAVMEGVCVLLVAEQIITTKGQLRPFFGNWEELFANPSLLDRYSLKDVGKLIRVENGLLCGVPNRLDRVRPQTVPLNSPNDVVRVLCLGESSVFGFPLAAQYTFPALVKSGLETHLGGKECTVFNGGLASASSLNCLQVASLVCSAWRPHVVIIYAGHNEYLPMLAQLDPDMQSLPKWILNRLFGVSSVLRNTLSFFRSHTPYEPDPWNMSRRYPRPDAHHWKNWKRAREMIENRYRRNLELIVSEAHAAGAKVLLLSVASNLSIPPVLSFHSPDFPASLEPAFNNGLARAKSLLESRSWERLLAEADSLLQMDAAYPLSHFLKGRALVELGARDRALASLRAARDLEWVYEYLTQRAPTKAADIVSEVASRLGAGFLNVEDQLVNLDAWWQPSNPFFVDDMHFSVSGNRVVADLIVRRLAELGWLNDWRTQESIR